MNTNKITKEEYFLTNLKLCCYERTANAETFENTIKVCGLTMEIINLIASYYSDELKNMQQIKF